MAKRPRAHGPAGTPRRPASGQRASAGRDGSGAAAPRRLSGVVVFLIALGVRGIYLVDTADYPAFAVPVVDALEYDHHARELASGGDLGQQFFWQPFLYPFLLSGIYAVNGGSVVGAKVVQALIGAVTCVLTWLLGRRVFGRSAGLAAGLMTAFYGPLVFYEGELLAAGWAAFWSVALILLLLRAAAKPGVGVSLAVGLCGGLAVLTRPTFLPFCAVAGLWLGWRLLRVSGPRSRRAGHGLAVVAGFAMATLPVAVESQRVTGRFSFLPSSGGINVYLGNHPERCRMATVAVGFEWDQLTALPLREGITGMWAQQDYFYRQTRAYVAGDPAGLLQRLGTKALQYVSSREIPRNVDAYAVREWSLVQRLLTWRLGGFGFPFGLLLPLAVVGLWSRRRQIPAPLAVYLLLYPLAIVAVFVTARYRVPTVPVLAVPAAAGLLTLASLWKQRLVRRLVAAGAGVVAIVLLASLPGPFCEEEQDTAAGLYANVGYYHLRQGDKAEAMRFYGEALRRNPDLAEARCNVGNLLAEQGRPVEALRHYEIAVQHKPHLAGIQNSYGAALLSLGRRDEAVDRFREAVRRDPTFAQAHANLGVVFLQAGRPTEAVDELREAVRLEPQDPLARYNLAVALSRLGDHQAAVAAYREALRLSPQDVRVHYGLAYALEHAGQIGEAIEHYRLVVNTDPRFQDARQRLERLLHKHQAP